ncbi:MAG: hypothetical protein WCG78_00095 [Candidatus Omnitrophota bacterium]
MLGLKELKETIKITKTTVECPVKGCAQTVARQSRKDRLSDARFQCPRDKISISPSTFAYQNEFDNMLWKDDSDRELFESIKKVKRESRIDQDNSEDAVTWNVFRFLEKNKLIGEIIGGMLGIDMREPEIIYWSYSQSGKNSWPELNRAREEFGEVLKRSSEPDIIIDSSDALLFIEAKLTAQNKTEPHDKTNSKKYEIGGDRWFDRVVRSDYKTVAITDKKYELLRFWLLGTWMANRLGKAFYLVNLVLDDREKNIEELFRQHIHENDMNKFVRIAWEGVYQQILSDHLSCPDKNGMVNYFRNKCIGYKAGVLQKAFMT